MDQWIIQWQNEVTKEIRRRKERGWNNNATTTAAQDGFLGPFGVVVEGRPHIRTTTNAASRKSHLFCKHCQTMHTTWCKARAFWSFLASCKYQSRDEKGSQVFVVFVSYGTNELAVTRRGFRQSFPTSLALNYWAMYWKILEKPPGNISRGVTGHVMCCMECVSN